MIAIIAAGVFLGIIIILFILYRKDKEQQKKCNIEGNATWQSPSLKKRSKKKPLN
jgi:preprotein translocase subunit SecG